jgi:serine/threonine protein kinase
MSAVDVEADSEVLAGRYELGEVIGHGGMSVVRRGMDRQLQREVAVKLLRPAYAAHPESRRRFEEEARAAARISHPSVVTVFDSGEDGEQAFLVMECLPGRTLADLLGGGPLPEDQLRSLAIDLLGALAAAHAVGVVHRDVKPGNVLLTPDGSAKLADFGIAKTTETPDLTATGLVVGTAWYVAPERLAGRPASPASDLYSLGVVLYEAAAGEKPHEGSPPLAVEPRVAAAIERALEPDPAKRFGSAAEMRAAITGATTATAAPPTAPMPLEPTALLAAPAGTRRRRRSPWAIVAAVAALLVGALAVAAFALDDGGGDKRPATTTSTTTTTTTTAPPTTVATTTVPTTTPPPPTKAPKPKPGKGHGPGPGKKDKGRG